MSRKDSYKPKIVEELFATRKRSPDGSIQDPIVKKSELSRVIESKRKVLGLKEKEGMNLANFFKDIIRWDDASKLWPESVFNSGYTARQDTGDGNVFEFVKVLDGQSEAFPNVHLPSATMAAHSIQTVSVNNTAKSLGIKSEAWLMQVIVQVKVLETHFSLFSCRKQSILQIDHLQTGKKGKEAEIDGLFMALEFAKKRESSSLITVEAKSHRERIIPEQVKKQVIEAIKIARKKGLGNRKIERVIPCAVKKVAGRGRYFVEFRAIEKADWEDLPELVVAADALYQLVPPIKGI